MEKYKIYRELEKKLKKSIVGKVFKSTDGEYTIIGINNFKENKSSRVYYYVCEFENGGQVLASYGNVIRGNVRNPYKPSYHNVGYLGRFHNKRKDRKLLDKWTAMISRCYNENDHRYDLYKDAEVCDRWHNFSNYVDDMPNVIGYNEFEKYKDSIKMDLDKDILTETHLYSADTSCFIPHYVNSFFIRPKGKYKVKGLSLGYKKWRVQVAGVDKSRTCLGYEDLKDALNKIYEIRNELLIDLLENKFSWIRQEIKNACYKKLKREEKEAYEYCYDNNLFELLK